MSCPSAEPELYAVDCAGRPTLFGLRDSSGFVSFPFQTQGSENNGDHGDLVTRVEFGGVGTISAVVEVHLPVDPAVGSPYRLASVVLDEGPMVRSVLVDAVGARIGTRVRAVTVPLVRDGQDCAELRFTPVEEDA